MTKTGCEIRLPQQFFSLRAFLPQGWRMRFSASGAAEMGLLSVYGGALVFHDLRGCFSDSGDFVRVRMARAGAGAFTDC